MEGTQKTAYDLMDLRSIVSGLHAKGIVSQGEQTQLLEHLGQAEDLTEGVLDEASSLTTNKAEVLDALMSTFRADVGEMPSLQPATSTSEPAPPAETVNDMLSS